MDEFRFEYKKVNSKSILSEPSYQREVDLIRVKKIVSNFNSNLVNPIKVSYRNGKYYVFDGQHTLKALVLRNGNRDLMVDCKVYYGMTYEDEARMFAEQNGISRPIKSDQRLKSLYEAKDVDVVDFKETVESIGIRCSFTAVSGDKRWGTNCYSLLFSIYSSRGKKYMTELLKIIAETWEGDPDSFKQEIIKGIDIFVHTYKDEYDRQTLIKRLSLVSPTVIRREGRAFQEGGYKRFARVILNIYNKRTKNKLKDRI